MLGRTVLLGVALWCLAGSAQAAVFYPSNFTLSNGLQVVVVPNHLAPVVSQMVWYKVGAADEAKGKHGLAHYLEHLMFRGTETVGPGEFSKIIAGQGGRDNAFTSYDYTAYYEEVEASRLAMIMQMEADRMQNLRIAPDVATPEHSVVMRERQQRTDNNPGGRFVERFNAQFMPGYPYGLPIIGAKKELEKLTVNDARKFYESAYAPNNAIVVISGDVRVEDVMSLAAATYGRVPKREVFPRPEFKSAPMARARDFTMKDSRVEQPSIVWKFVAPSYATQKDNAAYVHEVLAEVLDNGEVGILYKRLVKEQGLASDIDISYDPDARGETSFSISATPRPGRSVDDLKKALRRTLADVAHEGVDMDSVEKAQRRLQRAAIYARESLTMPGYAFGMGLATGHTVADVEAWPDRISEVTTEQVNGALLQLASSKRESMGALIPVREAVHRKAKPVKEAR